MQREKEKDETRQETSKSETMVNRKNVNDEPSATNKIAFDLSINRFSDRIVFRLVGMQNNLGFGVQL